MIRIYVGPPGSCKTVSMVSDAIQTFRNEGGTQVYSNMAGLRCPEYMYIEGARDFASLSRGLVLLDEAGVFFSSRSWHDRDKRQIAAFAQVRKERLDLWITTQHENRIDTILRENCSEILRCSRTGPVAVLVKCDPHADAKEKRQGRRVVALRQSVFRQYDTLERINEIGGSAGSGPQGELLLSTVARRRYDEQRLAEEVAERRYRTRHSIFSRWSRGSLRLTSFAQEVQDHLADRYFGSAEYRAYVPLDEVWRECERRRWLSVWGLSHADVPKGCNRENPWLKGFDPVTVSARNDEAERERLAADLIAVTEQKLEKQAAVQAAKGRRELGLRYG